MMQTIFLDTSYLLALIRKKDARHGDALAASANHAGPFITTDLVLVELANCLSLPPYRSTAVEIIEKIRLDSNTTVVPFDSEGMEKALALYNV
jgi:predicted nucleic acid-binding protein